jgi:hypothetical protein
LLEMPARTDNMDEAGKARERARALDTHGKEAECMQTVQQAKEFIGPH